MSVVDMYEYKCQRHWEAFSQSGYFQMDKKLISDNLNVMQYTEKKKAEKKEKERKMLLGPKI